MSSWINKILHHHQKEEEMKKQKIAVALAAALMVATPVLAAEGDKSADQNPFNCDFEPNCEVAPGYYGKISAPASSKFNLAVGGFVKLDYAYNSLNFGPTAYFTPTNVPKDSSTAGQKDQSIFSIRQSRLWFKLAGPPLLGAKSNGLIEFDFSSPNTTASNTENLNSTPRLRHAFANLNWGKTQVLFGQTGDIFGLFSGNTIDFNSGSQAGFLSGTRNPQIRVTQQVDFNQNNFLKLVLGVQQPYQTNFNNNATTGTAGSSAGDSWGSKPNVAAQALFISKALGVSPGYYGQSLNNLTVGFSGIAGQQDVWGNNDTVNSWGVQLYAFVPVVSSKDGKSRDNTLTFEGNVYKAANVNGATAAQYVGTTGNLAAAKGVGYAAQLIYFPTQNLGLSTGYGIRKADPTTDYKYSNYEKSNSVFFLNSSYDLNAAIRVAVEYQRFETKYGNVTNVATAGSPLGGTADKGTADIGRLALYYFF
jgi:hypothetical protein